METTTTKTADLDAIAYAIRAELGAPWTYNRAKNADGELLPYGTLTNGARNFSLSIGLGWRTKRLEVGLSSPRVEVGGTDWRTRKTYDFWAAGIKSGDIPRATFSPDRAPAAVARAIKRRIIPAAEAIVATFNEKLDATLAFKNEGLGNANTLAALFGGMVDQRQGEESTYYVNLNRADLDPFNNVLTSGDTCYLNRTSLTVGQVTAMLEALAAYNRANPKATD